MPVNTRLLVRRGSGELWNSSPTNTLSEGELGLNTDNKLFKIGDGLTSWTSLPYYPGIPLASGTGIAFQYSRDSNSIVTGITVHNGIRAGSNISLTLNPDNTISIAGSSPTTVSSGTGILVNKTGDDYSVNLVDEYVRDLISNILYGNSGVGVVVDDENNTVTFAVTGIYSTQINDFNSAVDARIAAAAIDDEVIRDIVATGLNGGTGISINYDDNGSQLININVTGVSLDGHTHDDRYYTETELSTDGGGGQVHWNNLTSKPTGFAPSSHSHVSSDVSDFNSGVSGLLPVKQLTAGTGIGIVSTTGNHTISITGIPSSLVTDLNNIATTELVGRTGILLSYDAINDTTYIDTTGVSLVGHTHLWSNITDASARVSLSELSYLSGVTPGSTAASRALIVDASKNITGINNLVTTGNVTVGGDLVVHGTTTTVNSTTVDIGDNIIRVNTSGLSTGGFEVYTGSDYKQLIWNVSNNRWEFTGGNIYTSGLFVGNLNGNADTVTNGVYITDTGTITSTMIANNTIVNEDISSTAAIAYSKLNLTNSITNNDISSTGSIAYSKLNLSNSITNSDIATNAAIDVYKLSSSGITFGSNTAYLGSTVLSFVGLSSISGTSAMSPTTLHYCVIDGGTP